MSQLYLLPSASTGPGRFRGRTWRVTGRISAALSEAMAWGNSALSWGELFGTLEETEADGGVEGGWCPPRIRVTPPRLEGTGREGGPAHG